ncbi:hypothetical protein PTTG_07709 [Puccinia triticina 1-1 BBBD Race 1]|uniref:RNA-binding protein VTS1 n=1 Tax=Puccinia triticina (isolate 1-1 / race 1 (BBBD)) TaxID=630390 RepID=A0A180H2E5_PUCT1|nr:hypothetical protein PTTG_07709 [Puccinia triticina 1-1 BBBD Race 1]
MRANNVYRHQHSLSSSIPASDHFGSFFNDYGCVRSAGGPRKSLDVTRSLPVNGLISPRPPGLTQLRPNSEILSANGSHCGASGSTNVQPNQGDSSEVKAIDKWFENLQSYEATLQEMAAASLDVNFKEELDAIEQWFRVLSEAERAAALYSLMQSSTQVQIQFFITVLQQMACSDPTISMPSPMVNPATPSMEQQMEAKLSQLDKKSPASPMVWQFLTPCVNVTSSQQFLSPNSALFNESNNSGNPPIALSDQSARLNTKSENQISAPGQLLSASNSLKSSNCVFPGPLKEGSHSCASSPRPKSNGTLFGNNSQSTLQPGFTHPINSSTFGIDSQLSPFIGGSWASQVNTPLVPMFGNKDKANSPNHDDTAPNISKTSNQLAPWDSASQEGSNESAQLALPNISLPQSSLRNGFPLDDARKFRRQSKSAAADGSESDVFLGVLSGTNKNSNSVGSPQPDRLFRNSTGQSAAKNGNKNPTNTNLSAMRNGKTLYSPMNPQYMLGAQKGAVATQNNWHQGLKSASMASMNQHDPNMLNELVMLNTLTAGINGETNGVNLNGMANLAAMSNITNPAGFQNMANILNMHQQMKQVKNLQSLQQKLQKNGMMTGGVMASPGSAQLGMNSGFPMISRSPGNNKRSPTGRGSGKPTHMPGSGSNPDENLDMKLLNDIPAWLRSLRLHKYTPNFSGCTWQEMVLMSNATLEARGVAAVGARRKMLRTFETVRIIKGMALPGDGNNKPTTPTNDTDVTAVHQNSKQTNTAPEPESDKD